jgi:hypothetical protein
MIENIMSRPGAYAIFGVVSICLFFIVFGGAIVWALLQPRDTMRRMGALPLSNDFETDTTVPPTVQSHE